MKKITSEFTVIGILTSKVLFYRIEQAKIRNVFASCFIDYFIYLEGNWNQ